jgi:hypothetical protein
MRFLAILVLLAATACTASWERLVRYSAVPAGTRSVASGVYEAALRWYLDPRRDSAFVLADSGWAGPLDAFTTVPAQAIPSHWADTLKREVSLAFRDPALAHPADSSAVANVARSLGLRLVPPDTVPRLPPKGYQAVVRLHLSQPGFNSDSTIALIQADMWCGFLCGAGQTLFLARRPGYAWRIWHSELSWIS